jgi:hypothetical protein
VRFLPDVSLNAADHDGYVICIDGSCQGTGCPTPGTICFGIASGTSASVQAFGGIIALIDQKMGGRVGNANYTLYKLAGLETYSNCNASTGIPPNTCVFNDVTVGNTTIPGETGFTATAGYDETTGLGSVNVSNLVNNWNTPSKGQATTALTLNGVTIPLTVQHGVGVAAHVAVSPVSPATATPTGDVSLIASGDTACNSNNPGGLGATLSGGSVSFNTLCLPGGSYPVHAHYAGDASYLGDDSNAINVTVTPEPSQIIFGLLVVIGNSCSSPSSVTYGSAYVLEVIVADRSGSNTPCSFGGVAASPTGTVTLTDSFNGGTATPLDGGSFSLNSGGWFEDQTIQLAAGTHRITANYLGDSSFSATSTGGSTGPFVATITVGKASTTTSVAAQPTTVNVGATVTLTATVSTTSNAIANASQEPTGTVQFLVGTTPIGSPAPVTGGVATTGFAQATASTSTTSLPQGSDSITAQYSGDSNYSASPVSPAISVSVGLPGINVTPCSGAAITASQGSSSGPCLITVTGANGFGGTVTLSASVTASPSGAVYPPSCSNFGMPDQNFTAPNTITLTSLSTSGNATMTCTTTAKSGIFLRPSTRPFGRGWPFAGMAIALAGIVYLLAARRQRRWSLVPLVVLLAVAVTAGVSCNGKSYGGGTGGNPGTTKGAYTITVTATPSTGAAQTTTVTLTVQ